FPFMTGLLHYDFPYNVRELEGFIKRGIALCETGELDAIQLPDVIKDLMHAYGKRGVRSSAVPSTSPSAFPPPPKSETPFSGTQAAPPPGAAMRGAVPSEQELRTLLAQHHGNIAAVGREYGKERMQVHRWMKRYGINVDEYR